MSRKMSAENDCVTLYVGNLDMQVKEEFLYTLFSQISPVKTCVIVRDPGNDPYAFLEFTNHQGALTALVAMNNRLLLNKEMKVNWSTSLERDVRNDYHIFVGDLSPEIETHTLREAFAPFGDISYCRVVRNPQTFISSCYGFVSFIKRAEAENAIASLNGKLLGRRKIKTKWSRSKPPRPRNERCFWGKEPFDSNRTLAGMSQPAPGQAQYPYVYSQHMGYWYPQSYQDASQMPGQYLQGMLPGYPYSGGQYGYGQGYMAAGGMGVQLPATTWQSLPPQPPVPPTEGVRGTLMQQQFPKW